MTKKFFDVDSLLEKAENTKFTLQNKQESSRLVRLYDEKAAQILNEVNETCDEDKRSKVYASRMTALNEERCGHIDRIGSYIKEDIKLLDTLTSIQEAIETNEDLLLLLKEQTALLYQSIREPWSKF